jgi:valyl-tRNA synthetase
MDQEKIDGAYRSKFDAERHGVRPLGTRGVCVSPDVNMGIDWSQLPAEDRWILSRLGRTVSGVTSLMEGFQFGEASQQLYEFLWGEFCDWYIEMAKPSLKAEIETTKAVLAQALDQILRLLSPFMPFITEEIWQHLPGRGKSLALASFPSPQPSWRNERAEEEMRLLQDLVVEVRTIRAENKIPPQQKIRLWLRSPGEREKELLPEKDRLVRPYF